jgi:hypothetical protein
MRLKQTQRIRQTQQYRMVLRNFFVMVSSVIVLTSLALVMLITAGNNTRSLAAQTKILVDNKSKY